MISTICPSQIQIIKIRREKQGGNFMKKKRYLILVFLAILIVGAVYYNFRPTGFVQAISEFRHWEIINESDFVVLSSGENSNLNEYKLILGVIPIRGEKYLYNVTRSEEANAVDDFISFDVEMPFLIYMERFPNIGWKMVLEMVDYNQYGITTDLLDLLNYTVVIPDPDFTYLNFDHISDKIFVEEVSNNEIRLWDEESFLEITMLEEKEYQIFLLKANEDSFFENNQGIIFELFFPDRLLFH